MEKWKFLTKFTVMKALPIKGEDYYWGKRRGYLKINITGIKSSYDDGKLDTHEDGGETFKNENTRY